MSFRKIYVTCFFIFCFSSVSLEAILYKTFVRWPLFVYAQQKFINSYYEFKKKQTPKSLYSRPSYSNYFSLLTYFPKLYVTMFRYPKISHLYSNKAYQNPVFYAVNNVKKDIETVQNNNQTVQCNNNLEQKTIIQEPISLLDKQDMQSVELINKLMDIQDETSFKKLGKNFLELEELNQNYPELTEFMSKHVQSPNTTTFVEDLKQLAEQKKLPPQFDAAFQEHHKKIKSMGNWEYFTNFVPAIYKKFQYN